MMNRAPHSSVSPSSPALWMLIVAQLDPARIEYGVRDITPLLNIDAYALRRHCRKLWPKSFNRYFLSFDEAALLIYRVCRDGKKLPDLLDLHKRLLAQGVITPQFPLDAPHVLRAGDAIVADRAARAAQRERLSASCPAHSPRLISA